jgi:hypothetical protein
MLGQKKPILFATAAALALAMARIAFAADYGAGCCSSISPKLPPATAYGGYLARVDDPVNQYRPYVHDPLDTESWVEFLSSYLGSNEASSGPYSTELALQHSREGASLHERERYSQAVVAYGRAIHLLRINDGLETPLQVPLLQQVIEAELAQGKYVDADNHQRYLFRIQRENLRASDPEMLLAVEQFADWQRNAYVSELDRERYPRILGMLDLYTEMVDAVISEKGESSLAALPYLRGKLKAQYLMSIYPGESEAAISVEMHQQDDVSLPTLKKMRFMRFRDSNFRYGEQNIRRMLDITKSGNSPSIQDQADLVVALGDWYQWHHRYALAQNAYAEAWHLMEAEGEFEKWQRQNFGAPLELPREVVFQPGRLAIPVPNADEVRVRFSVSRHGKARDIEVILPAEDENEDTVNRGYRFLRDIRFRPSLVDGEAVTSRGVERSYVIRY